MSRPDGCTVRHNMAREQEQTYTATNKKLNFKGCNKLSRDLLEKLIGPQLFRHFFIPRQDMVRQQLYMTQNAVIHYAMIEEKINPSSTKRRLLYLKTQSVPRNSVIKTNQFML